ncbi:hypothetical protein BKA70DRAFT_1293834 [Coprinopsis sp. MPI-PUGE-AT-0042]|nr:hypothetical protein BKA70DRAFT_1293834 [Coprinopsis sp. MPI-PUGE-AT-0042]
MLSTYTNNSSQLPSNGELAIQGPQAQAHGGRFPSTNPGDHTPMEVGSEDLAAIRFFSEMLNGPGFVNSTLLPLQSDVFALPSQELRSGSATEDQPQARLPASSSPTTDTPDDIEHETQTMGLQRTVEEQQGQLEELRRQITRYDQRCTYYRAKAATFKALYSQQRGLSEQIMGSLVHLRQNPRQ